MAEATFTIDPAGMRALFSTGQAEAFLKDRAQAMIDEAGRLAPRGFMGYRASLAVGKPTTIDGAAAVPAGSSSGGWHLVEFGSINNPAHRVLERSARASGLDFRESG